MEATTPANPPLRLLSVRGLAVTFWSRRLDPVTSAPPGGAAAAREMSISNRRGNPPRAPVRPSRRLVGACRLVGGARGGDATTLLPPTSRRRSRGSSPDGTGALSTRRRRLLSVGAHRRVGGAPWRDATTLLPPTSSTTIGGRTPPRWRRAGGGATTLPPPTTLYCTQFRNSFLARRPTELSEPGPYVGELKAQSSSIQLEIFNTTPSRTTTT